MSCIIPPAYFSLSFSWSLLLADKLNFSLITFNSRYLNISNKNQVVLSLTFYHTWFENFL